MGCKQNVGQFFHFNKLGTFVAYEDTYYQLYQYTCRSSGRYRCKNWRGATNKR